MSRKPDKGQWLACLSGAETSVGLSESAMQSLLKKPRIRGLLPKIKAKEIHR